MIKIINVHHCIIYSHPACYQCHGVCYTVLLKFKCVYRAPGSLVTMQSPNQKVCGGTVHFTIFQAPRGCWCFWSTDHSLCSEAQRNREAKGESAGIAMTHSHFTVADFISIYCFFASVVTPLIHLKRGLKYRRIWSMLLILLKYPKFIKNLQNSTPKKKSN